MYLTVDRLEGDFAVCQKDDKTMLDIPLAQLPHGIKSGDKLTFDGKNYALTDNSADKRRIKQKMDDLFQ